MGRLNAANIAMGLALFVWSGLYFMGRNIIAGAGEQRIPGFPNEGQLAYYIGFPMKIFVALLVVTMVCGLGARWKGAQLAVALLALLAFFPYMLFYTGGI